MKMSELLFHAIHVLTYYSLFLRNGGVFEICAARLDDSLELEGGTVSREEREEGERRRKWSWGGTGMRQDGEWDFCLMLFSPFFLGGGRLRLQKMILQVFPPPPPQKKPLSRSLERFNQNNPISYLARLCIRSASSSPPC